jgi:LPXTG-motif cell wall-anchored protein
MTHSGTILGAAATTTVALAVLPNTGMSQTIVIAVSVLAGLIIWGVTYAKAKR